MWDGQPAATAVSKAPTRPRDHRHRCAVISAGLVGGPYNRVVMGSAVDSGNRKRLVKYKLGIGCIDAGLYSDRRLWMYLFRAVESRPYARFVIYLKPESSSLQTVPADSANETGRQAATRVVLGR